MNIPADILTEIDVTYRLCNDFLKGLWFLAQDASRDQNFNNSHLLHYLIDDYVESAMSIPLLINESIHNVCFRELRFILEMSIKICFIQQQNYNAAIDEKIALYKKYLNSPSISIKNSINIGYLKNEDKSDFFEESGRIYGETSNYAHLTFNQIEKRMLLFESGRTLGNERVVDVKCLNSILFRTLSCSFVYLANSVPAFAVGDLFVDSDGKSFNWMLSYSKYIALIDEYFDYKCERQEHLDSIRKERWDRVKNAENQFCH